MIKVAIVEIGGSHSECLYSQILFLKNKPNVSITLIVDSDLADRVASFKGVDNLVVVHIHEEKWKAIFKICSILFKGKFDKVILNTAQTLLMKNLVLLSLFHRGEWIGVIHDLNRFLTSSTQKQISLKVKKYFLLNDYLLNAVPEKQKSDFKIGTFYPIFFQESNSIPIQKPENETWFCIPGSVFFDRRDYEGLIEAFRKRKPAPNQKFILLGKCGEKEKFFLGEAIEEMGLESNFLLWDDYVDFDTFASYIEKSDYVLPLIHPNDSNSYIYHRISGNFNLAFGYKKVMLLETYFQQFEDFKENCEFYEASDIMNMLDVASKKAIEYNEEGSKWSFEVQKEKYWELLDS